MMKKPISLLISAILISACLSISAHAAGKWQKGIMDGKAVAVSPSKKVTLQIIKPKDGIWGHFIIPLSPEHTKRLKKHRINPHYSFIPAYITIDKIERRSTGKVNQYQHYISIDVDRRQWNGLKRGKSLQIELPDGSVYKETLKGSFKIMKKVERGFISPLSTL
ncbi:hypothetical protein A9Q81_16505 [Gammaproteobacteria bacterium 42_54_T18]|nr:hypothetical protein A9Q81_16505 [Gammaproteobacteria bacterium 42_54_T18]